MRTLQNCVLVEEPYFDDEDELWWGFELDDGSIIYVREANIVTSHDCVYRASKQGTLTPLKSTIRKNRDDLFVVVKNFPEVGRFEDPVKALYYGMIGWDYPNDKPVTLASAGIYDQVLMR